MSPEKEQKVVSFLTSRSLIMFEKMNGIEDEEIKEISDTLSRHELETIYEF
jgi:hypothetical protein